MNMRLTSAPGSFFFFFLCLGMLAGNGRAADALPQAPPPALAEVHPSAPPVRPAGEVLVSRVHYEGRLSETEARFTVDLALDSTVREETVLPLFEGDLAMPAPDLPRGLRLEREGHQYRLRVSRAGTMACRLALVARITRTELWNEVAFSGPAAGISSLTAEAVGEGVELQLLAGTRADATNRAANQVRGFLGADRRVALRWQGRSTEAARPAVATCHTAVIAHLAPAVAKFTTVLDFEFLQGTRHRLTVAVPAAQALTQVEGEGIRDWSVSQEAGEQVLSIEFIKPLEKAFRLTLHSDQPLEATPFVGSLTAARPLEVERETGLLTLFTEDTTVEAGSAEALRQMNPPEGAFAAYRFSGRPFALPVTVRRLEPEVTTATRVTVRLEETRLRFSHAVTLQVAKAGIYAAELSPVADATVVGVQGDGVEDWKVQDGRLLVVFSSRVLGSRLLTVELERPWKALPPAFTVTPLRVAGARQETTRVGAASAPGAQLKTGVLQGLREIPVTQLQPRSDELLAFAADQPDWVLQLTAERLPARTVAEIFNLITIGDGLVGGSATLRYGMANQGVQEFRVSLPTNWKNLEFTGPNIRRKDLADGVWTITLQDKVWDGYTLVVTYDEAFDPHQATLRLGGIHAVGVERETGSIAITSAAGLQFRERQAGEPLRPVDEADLAETDRALITRSVLLAYRYSSGDPYQLLLDVTRLEDVPVLAAVADRTQLTTVLTAAGQMLTQASFMVKNNDKPFQRFTLPAGAEFWSCFVEGKAVKAEKDGAALQVPLPRGLNRDQAFPVEIVYAQKGDPLSGRWPAHLALEAPRTDVQTTYAEWEVYVPDSHELARFGGNLTSARGTTYTLRDAGREFLTTGRGFLRAGAGLLLALLLAAVLGGVAWQTMRRGRRGLVEALAVGGVLAVLGGMLAPSLRKATGAFLGSGDHEFQETSAQAFTAPGEGLGPAQRLEFQTSPGLSRPSPAVQPMPPTQAGAAPSPDVQVANALPSQVPLAAAGTAANRPLRIEVPRAGKRFVFTKVLNIRDDRLAVSAWAIDAAARLAVVSTAQVTALVLGLGLAWVQWRRGFGRGFLVALGLTLSAGSVVSLLMQHRLLGVAVAWLIPGLLGLGLLAALRAGWRRLAARNSSEGTSSAGSSPAPAVPVILLLVAFGWTGQADPAPAVPKERITIRAADFTGVVEDKVARLEAVLQVTAPRAELTLPLFAADLAVTSFHSSMKESRLVREDGRLAVRLPRAGEATLKIGLLINTRGDVTGRQLSFGIPAALSSRLALTIDEPEAALDFPSAVACHSTAAGRQTKLEAILGAAETIDLHWAPRVKRAAETALAAFCRNVSLVRGNAGALNVRTRLDYQITQGELREARIKLPPGHRLLRVDGDGIRTWQIQEDGTAPILRVDLIKGVSPAWRLTLETEAPMDRLPATAQAALPQALEVRRETGLVGLAASEEFALTTGPTAGLQKVDAAEFHKAFGQEVPLAAAWQFIKPGFSLALQVEALQPLIEAQVFNHLRIGTDLAHLQATVDYQIKRVGVFTLRVALPAGFRLESVGGDHIAQWVEKPAGTDARIIDITLKQRTAGTCSLRFDLVRPIKEVLPNLKVAGVHPLEVAKLGGYVLVSTETGWQAKTASFDGLTEVPAAAVMADASTQSKAAGFAAGGLAYKFLARDPVPSTSPWNLTVGVEAVEPWVRAEVVNWVTLTDSLVHGRSLVRFDVANAPVKEFRIRVPAEFRNVEVTAPNMRRRDQTSDEWRVELQSKVIGPFQMVVTWEKPWSVKQDRATNSLALVGVSAGGVERETGWIALIARPPLQVSDQTQASDLLRLDAGELPEWAGRAEGSVVLARRYLRPGWSWTLAVQRFEQAGVLQALAEEARLTTVVAEDGQMMTEMRLMLRNQGRQHLEVALPDGAQVWSAFVAGEPVRPTLREGRLLLSLEPAGRSDGAFPVEVTYVGAGRFPERKGEITLLSPSLDVPIKDARWELYLPTDYGYRGFAGTMTRDAGAAAVVRRFTLGDYSQEETRKRAVWQQEVASSLSSARSQLAGGNAKEAAQAYKRALQTTTDADPLARDARQLRDELNRMQGSNLVKGQQAVIANNASFFNNNAEGQRQVAEPAPGIASYDAKTAERQWEKLQQAQEIATAKARPLRVNLPTHGTRHTFSQVLQTQVGRPMAIRFQASHTRSAEWPTWTALAGAMFLGFWALSAYALRAPRPAASAAA